VEKALKKQLIFFVAAVICVLVLPMTFLERPYTIYLDCNTVNGDTVERYVSGTAIFSIMPIGFFNPSSGYFGCYVYHYDYWCNQRFYYYVPYVWRVFWLCFGVGTTAAIICIIAIIGILKRKAIRFWILLASITLMVFGGFSLIYSLGLSRFPSVSGPVSMVFSILIILNAKKEQMFVKGSTSKVSDQVSGHLEAKTDKIKEKGVVDASQGEQITYLVGMIKSYKRIELEKASKYLGISPEDLRMMIFKLVGDGRVQGEWKDDNTFEISSNIDDFMSALDVQSRSSGGSEESKDRRT